MRIRTKYKTNASGRGQIVARTAERQYTHNYDDAKSSDYNHGAAAGILASRIGLAWNPALPATHKSNESGTEHVFEI